MSNSRGVKREEFGDANIVTSTKIASGSGHPGGSDRLLSELCLDVSASCAMHEYV